MLRIILAGQPELNEKLDSPELVQLTQRVRLRFHLGALCRATICAPTSCIASRSPAPMAAQIFAEDTFPEICRYIRRHAAPREHAVRHRDDVRLQRGPRSRDAARHRRPRSASCSGWNSARASARIAAEAVGRTRGMPASRSAHVASALEDRAVDRRQDASRSCICVPGRKVVGRTPDNDLQIDSKFISRHHCQLITGSDGITVIEDLNSTNGIMRPRQARAPPHAARWRRDVDRAARDAVRR